MYPQAASFSADAARCSTSAAISRHLRRRARDDGSLSPPSEGRGVSLKAKFRISLIALSPFAAALSAVCPSLQILKRLCRSANFLCQRQRTSQACLASGSRPAFTTPRVPPPPTRGGRSGVAAKQRRRIGWEDLVRCLFPPPFTGEVSRQRRRGLSSPTPPKTKPPATSAGGRSSSNPTIDTVQNSPVPSDVQARDGISCFSRRLWRQTTV